MVMGICRRVILCGGVCTRRPVCTLASGRQLVVNRVDFAGLQRIERWNARSRNFRKMCAHSCCSRDAVSGRDSDSVLLCVALRVAPARYTSGQREVERSPCSR